MDATKAGAQTDQDIVTGDLDSLSFGVLIQIVGRYVTAELDMHSRRLGLASGQLSLLGMVQRRPGLLLSQYASILKIDDGTLSRYAIRLEERGYVTRERHRDDSRGIALIVTELGKDVTLEVRNSLETVSERYDSLAGADLIESLGKDLRSFMYALDPSLRS